MIYLFTKFPHLSPVADYSSEDSNPTAAGEPSISKFFDDQDRVIVLECMICYVLLLARHFLGGYLSIPRWTIQAITS